MAAKLNLGLVHAKLLELTTGAPAPLPFKDSNITSLIMNRSELPEVGGVYVFYWWGDNDLWSEHVLDQERLFLGPSGKKVKIRYTGDWLRLPERIGRRPAFRYASAVVCRQDHESAKTNPAAYSWKNANCEGQHHHVRPVAAWA